LSFKKTRLIPGKLPPTHIQEAFRDKIDQYITRARGGENELYFFDACHCIHNNTNGYEWQRRGKSGTKIAKTNSGRKRYNVIGALNVITKRPHVFLTEANCDQALICLYLESLRAQHPQPNKEIILILDNAPYNHSYEVGVQAKSYNIRLEFLPAYCPNLNLIERLWKLLKKKTKTNKHCEKFADFQKTILNFFENLETFHNELDSLLVPHFEII
jgi:transposase